MSTMSSVKSLNILELRQSVERKEAYLSIKRIFDITFAIIFLAILSPIMIITAIVIRITSKGPAIYTQDRIGQNGIPFTIYKFRSMYMCEENDLFKFVKGEDKEKGAYFKQISDPRITPIGKFLRTSSIDELPQLFNVVLGNMSLVGPRPIMPYYLAPYPYLSELRTVVKPGITGWWQVKNRVNSTTILDMVDYDLEYIKEANILFDIKILLMTIPTVLKCEGAR